MINLEQIQKREPLTGAATFLDRIIYAQREQKDAMVLYFGATHIVSGLNTMGRLLITSPDSNSGKTTVLDAAMMMCQNPWMSDPTKWALQGKMKGPDRPTVIIDEISIIFGLNGQRGRSNPIYKPAVEGYRKTATFSGQVDGAPQDFSGFCATILAGLKSAVPPDLRTRCVPIVMMPAPSAIDLEDSLDDGVAADGERIGEQLHNWTRTFLDEVPSIAREIRKLHPKLKGRKLQVWCGMGVIARMAGGEWPQRFLNAFVSLALDENERPVFSPEQQLLYDTGVYLSERALAPEPRYLFSAELLRYLRTLDEKLYTSKTDRQMAMLMKAGLGSSQVITLPSRKTVRGWATAGILAAYRVLLDELQPEEPEDVEDEYDTFFDTEDADEGQAVA